jgi:hypothetical protein
LTYIEAQALVGDMDTAQKRSNEAFKQDNKIRKGLCGLWKRVQLADPRSEDTARVNQILSDFQCTE